MVKRAWSRRLRGPAEKRQQPDMVAVPGIINSIQRLKDIHFKIQLFFQFTVQGRFSVFPILKLSAREFPHQWKAPPRIAASREDPALVEYQSTNYIERLGRVHGGNCLFCGGNSRLPTQKSTIALDEVEDSE